MRASTRTPTIGIDARPLLRSLRGIPLYLLRLCERLPALLPDVRFILFINRAFPYNATPSEYEPRLERLLKTGQVQFVNCDHSTEDYWEQILLPRLARKHGADLLFLGGNRIPFLSTVPVVVTVHDAMEYVFIKQVIPIPPGASARAKLYFRRQRLYLRATYRYGIFRAAHIITGSEHAKSDLVTRLHVEPKNVTMIHHGTEAEFLSTPERRPVAFDERRHCLVLGGDSFQKNAEGAVASWARVPPELRRRFPLMVAGFVGKDDSPLLQGLRAYGLEKDVTVLGWVGDDELASLFRNAAVFLFLSLYEGFGFPLLHAMAAGTPVVHSNTTSVGEVAAGAGLGFEPTDYDGIASGISTLLQDQSCWTRCQQAGLLRSADFSWDRSAAGHADVFRNVLQTKGRLSIG